MQAPGCPDLTLDSIQGLAIPYVNARVSLNRNQARVPYTKHSCLAASWYSISSFLYISTDCEEIRWKM